MKPRFHLFLVEPCDCLSGEVYSVKIQEPGWIVYAISDPTRHKHIDKARPFLIDQESSDFSILTIDNDRILVSVKEPGQYRIADLVKLRVIPSAKLYQFGSHNKKGDCLSPLATIAIATFHS